MKSLFRCNAEIGKPGNLHVCGRAAKWRARTEVSPGGLHYCDRHKNHAGNPVYTSRLLTLEPLG